MRDTRGREFVYSLPDAVLEQAHRIDRDGGGRIGLVDGAAPPEHQDHAIVSSLMEEAITSSQLEGAATTRQVAKQLLRSGRGPVDRGERMIVNNYRAMEHVRSVQREPMSPEGILELHRIVTEGTLADPSLEGRLRTSDDVVVASIDEVLHQPPPAAELVSRLEELCRFANGETPSGFLPPPLRAILLHYWLAHDHPFVDGNGRTARALFYWGMLNQGYWLFEFLPISRLLRAAPGKYTRAFLLTQTDGNDTTYFILHQLDVIRRALADLEVYLARKAEAARRTTRLLGRADGLNHRQIALLGHAIDHPNAEYTYRGHQRSHGVVYQTARTDLMGLAERGLLLRRAIGRSHHYFPPDDLRGVIAGMRG